MLPSPAPANKPKAPAKKLSGPAQALHKLGLRRDIDLALHLPMRYVDETRLQPIASLRDGDTAQVQGQVLESRVETRSRPQWILRLADASGELVLRLFNFYPSQPKSVHSGQWLRARGEVRNGFFGREMVHPDWRAVTPDTPLPTTLTPVYPSTAQLPQAYLRKAVASGLARAHLTELLPAHCIPPGFPSLRDAVFFLHQPPAQTPIQTLEDHSHPAWQRLKFEELLAQQLSQSQAHAARALLRAPALRSQPQGLAQKLLAALPFALTTAQHRVVAEIRQDLERAQPMHRLLQGDVGSGKTVVAALAAATSIDAGWQCALMAPTEILAEQHFGKLVQWLQPLGITTAWLSGSRKGKGRKHMLQQLASGEAMLAIGTHAVIQQDVHFARLGLAIVDEQHRFGVAQRLALRAKLSNEPAEPGVDTARAARVARAAKATKVAEADGPATQATVRVETSNPSNTIDTLSLEPHLLMMSATPIPRTLAMSYYADLELSTLDELPPGRTPILTKLFADSKRPQVIERIRQELQQGRQTYWVCPLVEESEHLDLQNATATHQALSESLSGCEVGLLHGRMTAADKAATMARFTAGELHLLVATTVIEVGVDVPNASLMVIEHAERFGLAQLHQLRGRVGRGQVASVCVLLYSAPLSPTAKARLKAMAETTDGFEIARRDLHIRGPGEFMGARQSGDALLRFADLATDEPLLKEARALAPRLLQEDPQAAQALVDRWLAGGVDYLKA